MKMFCARRVQFELTKDEVELLDRIKHRMGAASNNEVVRRSMRLMDLALKHGMFLEEKDGAVRRVEIV